MEILLERLSKNHLEPHDITLTCAGLSWVNWYCGDDSFAFVGRDNKVCQLPPALAEFLSPNIAHWRRCDPFCDVYTFKDPDLFGIFKRPVHSVRSGNAIQVRNSNFLALVRLSQELENRELFSSLLGMIRTDTLTLTPEEAFLLLQTATDLGVADSDRFGYLTEMVASHFYELSKETLDTFSLEAAQFVLSSPSLKIEDEDSLYEFVRYHAEEDLRFTGLFEFVYFEYLSVESIKNFASFISEKALENINSGIWKRMCGRLILEANLQANPRAVTPPGIILPYNESKPLEGIIAHLTRECGGNVHDKNVVNVTASCVFKDDNSYQRRVVELGTDSFLCSNDAKDTWVCYDFKDRRIIPTSYSVRSWRDGPGGEHLKSWIIEVSNDGTENSWIEIDRRENNSDLNAKYVTANFKISQVPRQRFRFIRLKQTGLNHKGNYYVNISSLEIFGTLFEE